MTTKRFPTPVLTSMKTLLRLLRLERTGILRIAGSGACGTILLSCVLTAQGRTQAPFQDAETGAASPVRDVHTLPTGEVFALVAPRNRVPDLVRLDPASGRVEVVSSGGFLADPQELVALPSGALVVCDRAALGGDGALIRVDPVSGEQSVLTFGAGLHRPTRVHVDEAGRLYAFDGEVVEVDARTGRQTRWGGTTLLSLGLGGARSTGGSTGGTQAISSDVPPSDSFQAPPKPPLPPETIVVIPTVVWIPNDEGYEDDVILPGGPFPLVTALKNSDPATYPVVSVYGDIPGAGMSFGAGDSDFKDYVVHWGDVPMRFAIVGRNEEARIREFDLRQFMNDGRENGGIADVRFENLTIEARFTSAVSVPKGHNVGLVRFYDCHFAAGRENLETGDYHGLGYKWGLRGHGRGRYDFRGCSFDPVEEHCIYVDSPQGDCYFIDVEHRGSRRTAIQVVNRSFDNPGPSGFGTLLFQNVKIYDLWGDGGSGISVAGHLGDLVFRDIVARENPASAGSHGAIVVWTDADPAKGLYLHTGDDGMLYSTRSVVIESVDVDLPRSDRSHIAISGVEYVRVDDFQVRGNRTAFSFDSSFGAPIVTGPALVDGNLMDLFEERIDNGHVGFRAPCPLSDFTGFQSSISIQEDMSQLSDGEIDMRWCSMGAPFRADGQGSASSGGSVLSGTAPWYAR